MAPDRVKRCNRTAALLGGAFLQGKLGSARGKKKGAVEEEAPGVPELQRGALRVTLPIKAIVQHRNWLRSGECRAGRGGGAGRGGAGAWWLA